MKKIIIVFLSFFMLIFFITCITTYITYSNKSFISSNTEYYIENSSFSWPLQNNHTISSYFGFRISPITGLPSYHSGIDIPASQDTKIYSASSGIVSYIGFNGTNGYTILIQNNNITFGYSHVSPNFIVKINDKISKNQCIGNVGPKYINPTPENKYFDSTGKQTNGLTTGPHLHFSAKIDGKIAIDPLTLFN